MKKNHECKSWILQSGGACTLLMIKPDAIFQELSAPPRAWVPPSPRCGRGQESLVHPPQCSLGHTSPRPHSPTCRTPPPPPPQATTPSPSPFTSHPGNLVSYVTFIFFASCGDCFLEFDTGPFSLFMHAGVMLPCYDTARGLLAMAFLVMFCGVMILVMIERSRILSLGINDELSRRICRVPPLPFSSYVSAVFCAHLLSCLRPHLKSHLLCVWTIIYLHVRSHEHEQKCKNGEEKQITEKILKSLFIPQIFCTITLVWTIFYLHVASYKHRKARMKKKRRLQRRFCSHCFFLKYTVEFYTIKFISVSFIQSFRSGRKCVRC